MEIVFVIIFAILALPGVFVTLLPTMPGIPYMYALFVIAGFVDGWEHVTLTHLLILTGILVVSILVDYFSGVIGAKFGGASARSLKIGLVCLLLGTFIMPPFGGFFGLFLGILLSELMQVKTRIQAFRAATFSLVGVIGGVLFNFVLAIGFYVFFLIFIT